MFALNYNRKPTITYRRKPRIEFLSISSDDDSDLDEPEKTTSPMQQYKDDTISIVGEHATMLNSKLEHNVLEKRSESEPQPEDNQFQQPLVHDQTFHFTDETIVQSSPDNTTPVAVAPIPSPSFKDPSSADLAIPPIVPTQHVYQSEQLEIVTNNVDPFIPLQLEANHRDDNADPTAVSSPEDRTSQPPSFDVFDFPELPLPTNTPLLPQPDPKLAFDIFDFPTEEDTSTVKLMVASRKHALKRSISQVAPVPKAPPPPPSVLKKSKSELHGPKRVRFALESLVSTFHRTSLDLSQAVAVPTAQGGTEIAAPRPPPPQQPKLKRNLVSRLRGAAGQASAPIIRKYNFDDDEEDEDSEEPAVVEKSRKLENDQEDYRERMERELTAMMESEFDDGEPENRARPQYQPKNPMNVKVTYQSKKAPLSSQQDREMLELDTLLDRLRAGSSHL